MLLGIKKKNQLFFLIMFIMVFMVIETFSCFLWFIVIGGDRRVGIYRETYRSAGEYMFNRDFGVVFPKPNTEIVVSCSEWTDRYPTVPLGEFGVGVFDDGVDMHRPLKGLAFGDSFTRGAGSLNNIKFGWVEHIERMAPELDVLNLGGQGTGGQEQQFRYYRRIIDRIEHELLIVSLFTGNDFEENVLPYDMNYHLELLPDHVDSTELLTSLQKEATFNAG